MRENATKLLVTTDALYAAYEAQGEDITRANQAIGDDPRRKTMTDEITQYGFKWGPMTVERTTKTPHGRLVLTVKTRSQAVEILVSPGGRRIEVWKGGKRMEVVNND